ncbi:tyrosine-type recombinase/integrase [Paenibacillus sp. DR312]|uniref:tyrosine-type recombinase/integrase n=1 Tax=Paenibacillus sp. DR312 TaxID=2871175 RepID=UPI0021BBBB1D|nr:tyrosine-type recombinase/integrase [Paenibacillus sp. DR312]
MEKLNIEDLNWENCSVIVNGKGAKQREVYFTTECKVWLRKYLDSREDSCKALFVTDTSPVRRMAIPTLRWALNRLASRGAVAANVYPHRFRHTYACQLLDNGAPLEFIQGMLGHEKASTTQIYAQLRGERWRELYRRFFLALLALNPTCLGRFFLISSLTDIILFSHFLYKKGPE